MLIERLQERLAERAAQGLARWRRATESPVAPVVTVQGRSVLQFGSNDYLGLASDPRLASAAAAAMAEFGLGSGASHLVTGHSTAHEALEAALAAFLMRSSPLLQGETSHEPLQAESARQPVTRPPLAVLTFSCGYLANLAILTALCDRSCIIFADKLNHACLNDGALLSRAAFKRFPHNDVQALARLLRTYGANCAGTKLIAVDGVFSMDGDIAPLGDYLTLAEQFDAWLLVDDAHAFGVLGEGRGTAAHFGVQSERLITMGTLGKAAGVAGAFVAAHPTVIEWLVNTARPYIFTTAQPPLLAAAAREAVRIIAGEPERRAQLQRNIAQFRAECAGLPWTLLASQTAIQPLIVGENDQALRLSAALEERGLWVPAIRPPTVPAGSARLRVSLSAAHTPEQIERLTRTLHALAR